MYYVLLEPLAAASQEFGGLALQSSPDRHHFRFRKNGVTRALLVPKVFFHHEDPKCQ